MKVILKQAVPKLGKEGQVVNVKDGYARNFLFPQGIAILADKTQIEVLARRNAKVAQALADTKASAEATKAKIDGAYVKIAQKVGKDGVRLFGAVTSQDVADAVKAQLGVDVEKKAVLLVMPIKRLGVHDVELDIHRQVVIHIKVNVYDIEHPETAEIAVEAAEPETAEELEAVEA
ncbi:MAG: 50S ribosomal protein L9 [Armatimonadetes bacterium]|nr:50S ribosomal protein L9 [Armatimonadota bacterium]